MMTPRQRRLRARIAARIRNGCADDDPELASVRREFRADRIEQKLRHELTEEPLLTAEQRERLAAVLLNNIGKESPAA